MGAMYKKLNRRSCLFSGGMADLVIAVDENTNAQWVVRELQKRNTFNLGLRRGFMAGLKIRKKLSPHPNIVYSIEIGSNACRPYEIIEYVPGDNLRALILAGDENITKHPFAILKQAAIALAHVHEKGYLHLDIKAENFLVNTETNGKLIVKLTDFDLSKPATATTDKKRSGTPTYMAPEHLRHGKIGFAADIFSFGIMAYNLVTNNKMPFIGNTEKELMQNQMSSRYKIIEPKTHNPTISQKLNDIIMNCLETDPRKRFPNMSYLCKELGYKA